jgi:FKBP-type peptidyl-prolyl cis-trans isomerase
MIRKISFACATLLFISGASIAQNNKTEKKATAVETAFKKTANNLEYLFLKDQAGTKFIQDGSIVKMHIRTKIADSAMFDSYKMNNNEPIEQPLTKQFLGAFMEGFALLTAGDSAILRLPIDTAFKGSPMPPFAKSGDKVSYEVKIISVKTKAEADAEKEKASKVQIGIDYKLLKEYIKTKNLKTAKTASGIYYVIDKKGNGKHATAADKVKVHYKGYKLDGSTFDSSYDRGQPIEFPLSGVIKGWTEGIPLFEEGGKGTLLIPSSLAYGQNAPPGSTIKANEVLLFDVELIKINPEPEVVEAAKIATKEEKELQAYFTKNNINPLKTPLGTYYTINEKGDGAIPKNGDTVVMNYTGKLMDGTKFDSNEDTTFHHVQPFEFPLGANRVIKGWDETIGFLPLNSKATFYIPSRNGYGVQGQAKIPANSILIFDVQLNNIKPKIETPKTETK